MTTAALERLEPVERRFSRHAEERPADTAFRFVGRHAAETRTMTWGDLHREASGVAGGLRRFAGRPVAILCVDPQDFVLALCGCLLAGVVAVPVPGAAVRRAAGRIQAIVDAASPVALIAAGRTLAQPWLVELMASNALVPVPLEARAVPAGPHRADADPSAPVLMQFTSGSTGTPRGVVLSGLNLAANCAAIAETYGLSVRSRGFSWLPLHHDMGLVGHVLTPLWVGGRSTIMDPLLFLQSPLRWLRGIGAERATDTSAPNFAYQLCAREAGRADLSGLDLSTLTTAVCGGEPVVPETVEAFCAAFAPFGFDRSAFAPSYGLAEATLLVASGQRRGGPRVFAGKARSADAAAGVSEVRSVALGPPARGVAVRIVDAAGRTMPEGVIGEIEVSGDSVGRIADPGRPSASGRALTGDLGLITDGELVVTGRRKELIILRGANVHPADAEAAAMLADPAIAPGAVAAFGIAREGTEEMFVAFETARDPLAAGAFEALARRVNEAVGRATGHVPAAVLAVPFGALPRTTSGKIRRVELAELCRRRAIPVLNATDAGLLGAGPEAP